MSHEKNPNNQNKKIDLIFFSCQSKYTVYFIKEPLPSIQELHIMKTWYAVLAADRINVQNPDIMKFLQNIQPLYSILLSKVYVQFP